MAYAPTTWVEKATKVGPTNLNKLELGLQAAAAVADAAFTTPGGTNGQFLQRVGGLWVPHTLATSDLPSSDLAYGEQPSSVSVTATSEATANTVVTATAFTFDGSTAAYIEFCCTAAQPDPTAIGRVLLVWLYEDGVSIGELGQVTTPAAAVKQDPMFLFRRRTPASGSHTYSVRASVSSGTGTVFGGAGGAGATMPIAIRVRKA